MCKAAEVGKIVVNKCLEMSLFIDTQKLQKLLVLMQVELIKRTGIPLFKEDIRVWDCGVAIKEVDDEFKGIGTEFRSYQTEYINLLKSENDVVDYVLKEYGTKSAPQLNLLPVNQRVCEIGIRENGATVPHVTVNILLKEFHA